jgi:hypothetical protein
MTNDLGPADVLTPTQQVRLELRSRPGCYLSVPTLVELTGLSVIQVRSAIYVLVKQNNIIRRIPRHLADRASQQAYAWDCLGIN